MLAPKNHPTIIGHETVITTLEREFGNRPQEMKLLLTGESNLGKTTIAERFLNSIQCDEQDLFQPCGTCASCRAFDQGRNPDHRTLNGEGQTITVSESRDLIAWMRQSTLGYRTVLINQPESITLSASNALLKVIEEPPARTILIMTSARPAAILPTIRSRVQRLRLYRVPHRTLHEALPNASSRDLTFAAGRPGLLLQEPTERQKHPWSEILSDNYHTRRKALNSIFPKQSSFTEKQRIARALVGDTEHILRAVICRHLDLDKYNETDLDSVQIKKIGASINISQSRKFLAQCVSTNRFLDLNIQPELACEHLYLSQIN